MNFSKKRPVKIVMLGAGGTGAHIAPHLYRLLYALERPVKFIICDGDKVEPKNLVRQNFTEADLGENKARVIAERYSDVFGLETSYIPRFIEDAGQLEELLRPEVFRHYVYGSEPNTGRWVTNSELVILIGAVDNNKSRKLCHEVFLRARDLVYIDSGNGEYTGQIVCGIRRAGKLRMNRVSITLYDVVKSTGEVKDVFRFTYEGRDYICLSHSERIRAGLEVAELIKRLLGVEYPTFIDDVESVPVIDNVRPTGQVFIAKVIKGTALQVQVADNTGVPKAA